MIIGPLFEEMVYRGYLYNYLKTKYSNKIIPIIISNMGFGLVHVPRYGLSYAIVLVIMSGTGFTYCYEKTQCIWSPILLHSLYNIMVTSIVFFSYELRMILSLMFILIGSIISIYELIKYLKRRKYAVYCNCGIQLINE